MSRISKSFKHALVLPLAHESKYILFSDCHRGDGGAADNFQQNEFIYLAALRYYKCRGYTYLELGDGDELWESRSIEKIKEIHAHSFELLQKYSDEERLYVIYGNHDMVKKDEPGFYPAIILKDSLGKKDIYLTHGHQAGIMNSTFWKVNRFLVHYLWKNLELLGVPDPTSAAKNNIKKDQTEKRLAGWAADHDVLLVTGHTHRPMAGTRKSPYFNTGSCVYPEEITGIEIEHRCITLVKWSLGTRDDQTVYVYREVLGEKICIDEYV